MLCIQVYEEMRSTEFHKLLILSVAFFPLHFTVIHSKTMQHKQPTQMQTVELSERNIS